MVAIVCAQLLITPATHADQNPQTLDPSYLGMVIRDPWYDWGTYPGFPNAPNKAAQDRMGATLKEVGVRWVRLDFHIASNDIDAEIAKNDYFITEVAPRNNLQVLGLLSFDLLQGQDPRVLNTGPYTVTSMYGGGVNKAMDQWLDRALRIANRYRGQVHAYEILNEQNRLPYFDANGYAGEAIRPEITARLMTKFYRFCKNIEPTNLNYGCSSSTNIVLGGLHPRGTSSKPETGKPSTIVMSDAEYLAKVYDKDNAASPFADFKAKYGFYPLDGIGYHPYPEEIRQSVQLNNDLVDTGINRVRKILIAVGDGCNPFWITEIGLNVGFDPDGSKNPIPMQTATDQANLMDDVYRSLYVRELPSACGQAREVANVFWFKYEDFPPLTSTPSKGIWAQQWGIVRIPFTEDATCPGGACYDINGTPTYFRPSYYTYRQLAGLPTSQAHLPLISR